VIRGSAVGLALLDRIEDLPRRSRARCLSTDHPSVRHIGAFVRELIANACATITIAFGGPAALSIVRHLGRARRMHVPASRDARLDIHVADVANSAAVAWCSRRVLSAFIALTHSNPPEQLT